jgi:hypothetical protein
VASRSSDRGATLAEHAATLADGGPAVGERDSMLAERRIDLRIDLAFLYAARRLTPKRS